MLAPMPACIAAAITGGTSGVVAAVASLVAAGLAAARLRRTTTASADDAVRKLRHDLRGALSPALLATDRLLGHEDPAIQRSGTIISQSIERAIALLADRK